MHFDTHGQKDVQKSTDRDRDTQRHLSVGRRFLIQIFRLQIGRNVVVVILFVAPVYADDQTNERGEYDQIRFRQLAFAVLVQIFDDFGALRFLIRLDHERGQNENRDEPFQRAYNQIWYP